MSDFTNIDSQQTTDASFDQPIEADGTQNLLDDTDAPVVDEAPASKYY